MNTPDRSSQEPGRSRWRPLTSMAPLAQKAALLLTVAALLVAGTPGPQDALAFPRQQAAWHRGDVSVAQENSRPAILAALASPAPNLEVDVIDFIDAQGRRTGLVSHDLEMDRLTGRTGRFFDHHDPAGLPKNMVVPTLAPEPFLTVLELFELITAAKVAGRTPYVSLDIKEDGATAEELGLWLGSQIRKRGLEDHVFASSFFKAPLDGIKETCPECLTGGLVFSDHFALQFLNYRNTSLDLTPLGKWFFFLGFPGKQLAPHDFVLIQDDILIENPDLPSYWKTARGVKFVGAFSYDKSRAYSAEEWRVLRTADWLELEPRQMRQWLEQQHSFAVKGESP